MDRGEIVLAGNTLMAGYYRDAEATEDAFRGGSFHTDVVGARGTAANANALAIPGFAPPVNALCVAPAGMEEGTGVELPDEELGLVVGETAVLSSV